MDIGHVHYVSVHFRNGESKGFAVNEFKALDKNSLFDTDILFMVVNRSDESSALVVKDIHVLCGLI